MDAFLMIGQSNMAGRGFPHEVEPIVNKEIRVMRNGIFYDMYVPVNPDRSVAGISLAESFADTCQRESGKTIGLIPCADGGTRLEQWQEGTLLFDHACYMTELAARTAEIKAILWHQGEGDCGPEDYGTYGQRLKVMMTALRRRLGMPEIPILLGGLGDFLGQSAADEALKNYVHINAALQQVARELPNCAFVPAVGLGSNPDQVHFSAAALREFGLRYYEAYKKLTGI